MLVAAMFSRGWDKNGYVSSIAFSGVSSVGISDFFEVDVMDNLCDPLTTCCREMILPFR